MHFQTKHYTLKFQIHPCAPTFSLKYSQHFVDIGDCRGFVGVGMPSFLNLLRSSCCACRTYPTSSPEICKIMKNYVKLFQIRLLNSVQSLINSIYRNLCDPASYAATLSEAVSMNQSSFSPRPIEMRRQVDPPILRSNRINVHTFSEDIQIGS